MKEYSVGTHAIWDSLSDLEEYLNSKADKGWALVAAIPGGCERTLIFERDCPDREATNETD